VSTTPPRGGTTIARVWKGAVRKQDGDAYARYMQQTGVAGCAKTPGNRGVWMLRRNVDDRTEFMTFTVWDSLEAVINNGALSGRRLTDRV
jgi:heme-degrading monooxygenase HmoA